MPLRRIALIPLVVALLVASACGSDDKKSASTSTSTTSGSGSTTAEGSSSPEDAAKALHAAWKDDDKAAAAEVADEAAIDTLFAAEFPNPDFSFYGCGADDKTFKCVYYDEAGAKVYRVAGTDDTGYRVVKIESLPKEG